jgi:hypothetical protein
MLDPAKELTIRQALGTKIGNITGSAFIRRPIIDSKQDESELLGVLNVDNEEEMHVCTVDFANFVNSATDGCDDDPMVTVTYKIHLFREYKESRSDLSNSTDDFIALVLNLNNAFLNADRSLASLPKVETLPLAQLSDIVLGDDPLTGGTGHFVDFLARVQVN